MNKILDFDKVKNKVKSYFVDYTNELKSDKSLLKKFLFNSTEEDFSKLHLSEIYKLKDAIKQDKASIEFVFKLCQKYEGTQKALEKLKNEGAQI